MKDKKTGDNKVIGVYKVMKKFLLLIVIGIVLFMPKGVEAKEYSMYDEFVSVGHNNSQDFIVKPGDVLSNMNFSLFSGILIYGPTNFLEESYDRDNNNIPEIYTIKSYEELTGLTIPNGKRSLITLHVATSCAGNGWVSINYKLVDDNSKEVVYHNTYDAENNNPTSYYEEETDILLSDISRDGYKFLGWYTSAIFEEDTRVTMISKDEPEVLELYAKWEKLEEVVDSNEDNVFKNPETNSTSYILIGILSIAILGTVLTIVYRIKKVGE